MKGKYVKIYTDGSCYWKTREGGIGVYFTLLDENYKLIANKKVGLQRRDTTIGRCELEAILVAIQHITPLKNDLEYEIISDSEYVINSINQKWFINWIETNQQNRKNIDLWIEIYDIFRGSNIWKVKFAHTKGHGKGSLEHKEGNEIADKLACYKN